jgi:uncharacterized membrane protein YccC
MSTTSELAKRLDGMFVRFATETEDEAAIRRVATAREAAKHIDELERENARLREALKPFAWQTRVSSLTEEVMILNARAALAGSGEK